MKRLASLTTVIIAGIILSGCHTKYRRVARYSVSVRTDDRGMQQLSVVPRGYIAFKEVIERSPNVKSVSRVTDLRGKKVPKSFCLNPLGDALVFSAYEKIGGRSLFNLWKVPTAGGFSLTKVTAGRYIDTDPCFSENGTSIFFASNRGSMNQKIWRVGSSGTGGLTRITQGTASDQTPTVSNLGRIGYCSTPPYSSESEIWSVQGNGVMPTQLKIGHKPRFSPDGKKILYVARDGESKRQRIWIMNTDGSGETQLSAGRDCDETDPCWTPDGKGIVFASNIGKDSNNRRNFDIWIMSVDGTERTQLTTNGSTDLNPQIDPDGKFIYFLSNRGFVWDIWRMQIAH